MALVYAYKEALYYMRTTLILPDQLIGEAMKLTKEKTKTGVIKIALLNLIEKEKIKNLKKYYGKVDLNIDLNVLRKRWKTY